MENKIIVIDIAHLPEEYKNYPTIKEGIEKYKLDFNIDGSIVPYDSSKQNFVSNCNVIPVQVIRI